MSSDTTIRDAGGKQSSLAASVPFASIIIPCRNEVEHIERCLESILAQEALPDGNVFEVLVADGMSDDGTREKVRAIASGDPRVRLIDNEERIVSTGLNKAIRAARGEIVIRMDAHTEYASDYVRECVCVLQEVRAACVGGPWQARGERLVERGIAAAFQSPFCAGGARSHKIDFEGEVDAVYLGCWRKETLLQMGGFDEELVRNQDDELSFRSRLHGNRLWQSPRIKSWYRPRPSLASLFRQYLQYGYWKVRVIQKHRRPASLRHLVPVCFVFGLFLGWLPALIHWGLLAVYVAGLAIYGALNLFYSARAAARAGWDVLPVLPLVFLLYHVSYGLGFARGMLDFVVLRRGPAARMTDLTRAAKARKTASLRSARSIDGRGPLRPAPDAKSFPREPR